MADSKNGRLLWDQWRRHAAAQPKREAVVHWVAGAEPVRWSWEELVAAAGQFAILLHDIGVRAGDVCALMLRHHSQFYPLYLGVSALGAIPAVLAYPNPRLHPDKFRQGLQAVAARSGLQWLLTERPLSDLIMPLLKKRDTTLRQVLYPLEWPSKRRAANDPPQPLPGLPADITPDSPCLLQHSSGTTGLQKAVVLSHRAVLEHLQRYGEAIEASPADKVVSWLPLYHDMGLIAAFHLPLALGIPLVQLDPFEWVTAPVLLLEAISRERGSLAWLPNFAYNHMAGRIHDDDLEGISLRSLRMVINCSEPVRHESHEQFLARFAPLGLRRMALGTCYAMAETTFAVTQSPPRTAPKVLVASRSALAKGHFRPAVDGEAKRHCVSSGRLISGCEARVLDPGGGLLPEGQVGEICLYSASLFDGYRNNPEKTNEVLKEGWYHSGDLGFTLHGEFYVIGRSKDIIIVAGKNLYPEDIEDAVGSIVEVSAGRVVAFGVEDAESGTEQVCVVAETEQTDQQCAPAISRAIIEAGMKIDVSIGRVYLAPPRWLIKSSSGKLSRSANRERALTELTPTRK